MAAESIVRYHDLREPQWLVKAVNARGELEWFVRIEIAGLYPRRIGPFLSTDEALEFYEETLRGFLNDLSGFDLRCAVEDELGSAYLDRDRHN